jgi:hypothetical protein
MQDGFGWTPNQDCGLAEASRAQMAYIICVMDIERASE